MNFGNSIVEIQQKYGREKEKNGREKILNFGNHITEIPAAQVGARSVSACKENQMMGKKKFGNCGNAIAENGKKKIVCDNDKCTQFLQQILSDRLLLLD